MSKRLAENELDLENERWDVRYFSTVNELAKNIKNANGDRDGYPCFPSTWQPATLCSFKAGTDWCKVHEEVIGCLTYLATNYACERGHQLRGWIERRFWKKKEKFDLKICP